MATDTSDLRRQVKAFRQSVAPDVYSVETFVPWSEIEDELNQLAEPIAALQHLVDTDHLSTRYLGRAMREEPEIATVVRRLFTAPHGVGLADGRELPEWFEPEYASPEKLARLLMDLGLRRLIPNGAAVADLCRVALVAADSRRRGFRRKADLDERVESLIDAAIASVSHLTNESLTRLPMTEQPEAARGRADIVIAAEGLPVAAVASVFQATSGGRQSRDLSFTYPRLQEDLDAVPMCLLLIADGRGLLEASQRVLETLLDSVAACMTLAQAENALSEALASAVVQRGVRTARRSGLQAIISSKLRADAYVTAGDLPSSYDVARAALAEYASAHPHLALELARNGASITWTPPGALQAARGLVRDFSGLGAARLLAESLRLQRLSPEPLAEDELGLVLIAGELPDDPVLPSRLAIVGATNADADEPSVTAAARLSRQHVAGATIAVLLTADARIWLQRPAPLRAQRTLATSVVVIGADMLMDIVGSVNPRDALVREVLVQADLTKASPFRSTGATPPEMFFGRQQEAADLMSALASSSVAVIGGRRIGKTSLLHRATSSLKSEGWLPFYADLQEAGDWRTFADHVRVRWDVDVDPEFVPGALFAIVAQLRQRGDGPLVVILDEVDQLLRWDQDHGASFVPEAFFRACRALSQEGSAQFVFSGERTIAERLWDPSSPHWNFCRELPLRQLTRSATVALFEDPLRSLGVTLIDRDIALNLVWARTQGHPQIVQWLGEELVKRLNDRDPATRAGVSPIDIEVITDQTDYQAHYVTTYWGQATELERDITVAIADGATSFNELRIALIGHYGADTLRSALRMLTLYGILDDFSEPFAFRAAWMPIALDALGTDGKVASNG